MEIHDVSGGGGLHLDVREWSLKDGPAILFIHGWSQNHLCWRRQWESSLADEFRLVASQEHQLNIERVTHGVEMSQQPRGLAPMPAPAVSRDLAG
jgi:hypothetical protein